jgi:CCDC81-like prokaryotic HU domain 2/CCDC81-like prokaryotic HU domain 1
MQIDIPSHIEKLLFLHEALVIPGFGGFTATRTPATADYVGGTVSSPSKTLSFSENLTIDDGILISDITLTHGVSTEDAQRVVDEFVDKMQSLLNQREIVTLPGVGRLYKNYVQKIQFLPDATNFNAASYGLPPLQFSPIARAREVGADPTTAIPDNSPEQSSTAPPAPISPPQMPESTYAPVRNKKSSVGTALAIVLFLASLSAALWYWQHKKQQAVATPEDTEDTRETNPDTNVKENQEPPSKPVEVEKTAEELAEDRRKAVREQVKNGRPCTLVVATLSVKENADKLRDLLQEEGFDVYFQKKGAGYQVGIQFYYSNVSEIEEKKATLKQLTGVQNIVVTKK